MSKKHNHRKTGKRGYRLHDARIAYSGGTGSMRSIKYELKDPTGVDGLRDEIADAVISDNRALYGNINLNDYLAWRTEHNADEREYSFLGFWIKALNLGFIFSNKTDLEYKKYLGIKSWQEQLFETIPEELRERLDEEKWINWVGTPARPASGTENSLKKKIIQLFNDENSDILGIADEWYELCQKGEQNELERKKRLFNITTDIEISEGAPIYWACDVNFELFTANDWTELLDKIIDYWTERVGEITAKKFLGIGENGNHLNNGLFGKFFELVRSGDLAAASRRLQEAFNIKTGGFLKRDVIFERLKELRRYAEKLDERPKVVGKWADYRSDFNGTIESWYSNRIGKQKLAIEQLDGKVDEKTSEIKDGLKKLLDDIRQALPEDNEIRDGILTEAIEFIEVRRERIDRAFSGELEGYLATLKSDLNEWGQQHKEEEKLLPKGWQRTLSKHIQLSPLFFGESKRTQWEQIYNLKSLIVRETEKLERILEEEFTDYEIMDKQVDNLVFLFNRIKDDGNEEVLKKLKAIENELGVDFSARGDRARFYLSEFERNKEYYKKLDIPQRITVDRLIELAKLDELFECVKSTPQDNHILRDTTQLSKIVLSAKLREAEKKKQVETVTTHSNLQGYAALISKRKFVARYSVQATNGVQSQLAVIDDVSRKDEPMEKYAYVFMECEDGRRTEVKRIIEKGNDKANFHIKENLKNPNLVALRVESSRYQTQFLDWALGRHVKKRTSLTVGGAFTIAEREVELDWGGERPVAAPDGRRLFVSQPFTLNPKFDADYSGEVVAGRFIGVDIGEYGLAWSLIKADGDKIEQLESGFIADVQQQKLKKAVNDLRKNQAKQTFNSMDTYVARLRESLIGSYRNQLESLVLQKRAKLSFEYEVSAFETGGNKIVKVYDSIKRGSIHKKDNNTENKQAWGEKGTDIWGYETTAANTSRFCTKCKRVATEFWNKDETSFSDFYHVFRPDLGDGKQRAAAEERVGKEAVDRLRKENPSTIALFICPNCEHVADADKQAAFNIAVRGYLKETAPDELRDGKGKIKQGALTKEYLCEQEAKLNFAPIKL